MSAVPAIISFTGKNAIYSNFYECWIEYEGLLFPSVENAYQAAKTLDFDIRRKFCTLTPPEAKKFGNKIDLRYDWEELVYIEELGLTAPKKVKIMYDLVLQKFSKATLMKTLLDTKDAHLEEGNKHGDTFWGTVYRVGQNYLGIILMSVRKRLAATTHSFQEKPHAEYAIKTYGSELSADILNCAICNNSHAEHTKKF